MTDPRKTDIAAALDRSLWFRRQKPQLKRALVGEAQTVRAEAGHWLYDAGEEARGLYGMLSGSVRILVRMGDGDYALANIVRRGTIFGYAARLVGKKRLVTAQVRERSTLIYVPESSLEAIARREPDLWLHFAELASEHLLAATQAMVANARSTPAARIAMHLTVLVGDAGMPADLAITQDELAELSGLSRKTVNQVLKAFERLGAVETGYRRLRVLDTSRFSR
ncbi:MAG TPA: Crp/Fnr family transcriptional regulator [Parvibaculum sp.]|jgi:CRP-like cAMP-binding protein